MIRMGRTAKNVWHQRFEAARADLQDARRVLDARERLTAASGPIVFGDALALRAAARVGVFSGSFNPQTVAHAEVAEVARAARRLDVVIWALARTTVDKEEVDRANLPDRVVQLLAYIRATGSQDVVVVIDAGLYADQAEEIRLLVRRDSDLWLVVGFDKVVQIFDARYYVDRDATLRRLFGAAELLVAPRADQGSAQLAELMVRPENRLFASKINLLPVTPEVADVASTKARRLMHSDAAPSELWSLLTPEGAALGLVTGAYRDVARESDGTIVDVYARRNQWLKAMEGEP